MKKAIFFDRDGTLIIDKIYLNDPDQITYLPHVFESLAKLRDAGYTFVMVTNQSGVARGIVTLENLAEIHRRMTVEFERHNIHFAGIYYAPYSVESNHDMRKPNAGMLLAGAKDHDIDLKKSWIVGDRMTDAEAGLRAGCRSVLLEGVENLDDLKFTPPTFIAKDLIEMANGILARENQNELA